MADKLDPKLKEEIKDESENLCKICGRWCRPIGEPHHVVKVSEEPLLRNCKTNIWWLCRECHNETETNPGFNRKLQKILEDYYFGRFQLDNYYTLEEIQSIVIMPLDDLEKARNKGILKTTLMRAEGLEVIRFLMGGSLKND